MNIRIINAPPGEAPAPVRAAWVGICIPIEGKGPVTTWIRGITSKPHGVLLSLILLIFGPTNREHGYIVDATVAFGLLSKHAPDAAAWWRENTPYLHKPGAKLFFNEVACSVVAEPISK